MVSKAALDRLTNSPNVDRRRRRLRRSDSFGNYLQEAPTEILSDSEEEERRLNREIRELKYRKRWISLKLAQRYEQKNAIQTRRKVRIAKLQARSEERRRNLQELLERTKQLMKDENCLNDATGSEKEKEEESATETENDNEQNPPSPLPSFNEVFDALIIEKRRLNDVE